jgi:hypothetical protein
MPSIPPNPDEPAMREIEDRKVESVGNQPVLWALLGLLLIGAFVIALQVHWFGLSAVG